MPTDLVIVDLNADANLDIIVIKQTDQNLSVLMGKADGTFLPPVHYSLGELATSWPIGIAASDFNSDGKPDIAVVTALNGVNSGKLLVLLGNGDGTLHPPISAATNISPMQLVAADVNGDSKADLLIGGNGSSCIMFGNGDATFQAPQILSNGGVGLLSQWTIGAADLNGDGSLDVFTGNYGYTNNIAVYINNGDGTLSPPVFYDLPVTNAGSAGPTSIIASDVNNDGKLDIIVNDFSPHSVDIFIGNGDGTFQPGNWKYGGSDPTKVVAADFNGDRNTDIAIADYNRPNASAPPDNFGITVLPNAGGGTFIGWSQFGPNIRAGSVVTADLNADGYPDLVTADSTTDEVSVFINGANVQVSLAANPNAAEPGESVTLTATVTVKSGTPAPTGSVSFYDGPALLGTSPISNGQTATFVSTFSTGGLHDLKAFYSGDTNQAGSSSQRLQLEIGYATTTIVVASPTEVLTGSPVTLTATVTSQHGIPTGNVRFLSIVDSTLFWDAAPVVNGQAVVTISALVPGMHLVDARYVPIGLPPGPEMRSSSANVTVRVGAPTSITLAAPPNAVAGSQITLTANVTSTNALTGQVAFSDGPALLGSSNLSNGTATYTLTASAGAHSFHAAYNGDDTHLSSASAASVVTVSPDFAMTASSSGLTLAAGQTSATATVTITPQPGGFGTAIALSCSAAPAGINCTLSSPSVTPGVDPATVTVTVARATAGPSASLARSPTAWLFCFCCPLLGLMALSSRRVSRPYLVVILLVAFLALGTSSCGGGSGSAPQPPPTSTYTLTITGTSGTVQHSTGFTLSVR